MEKTVSETKEDLIRRTENIKHRIEDQISGLKQDAAKAGKIALIAGGAILVTYLIAKKIRGKNKVDFNKLHRYNKVVAVEQDPFVIKMIKEYMRVFLLSIAKQMIAQYLQRLNNPLKLEANTTKATELQEKWS